MIANLMGRVSADVEAGRPLSVGNLPPEEAIRWFKAKRIVGPTEFKRLSAAAKQRAFSIAGLHQQYALETAHASLATAITNGTAQRTAVKQLQGALGSAGLTGPTKHHLDLVFRNATQGAYQNGRWAQLRKAKSRRPFWRYQTTGDDRVRDTHQAQAGLVYHADDPYWGEWYPPNGHNCRCAVESLTADDVQGEGLEVQTGRAPERPDKGWATSPAAADGTAKAQTKLRRAVAGRNVLQPPRLAVTGRAVHASPGDIGPGQAARKALSVDRLAGLKANALQGLVSQGPFSSAPPLRALKRGMAEVRVPISTVHADAAEDLITRWRAPDVGDALRTLAVDVQASYAKAAGKVAARSDDVLTGGIRRRTEAVLSVLVKAEDVAAVADVALSAEAGSGAALRRAPDAVALIVRGAKQPLPGYQAGYANTRKLGTRTELRLSKQPLEGFAAEPCQITDAMFKELK